LRFILIKRKNATVVLRFGVPAEGTRLTLVESGFSSLPAEVAESYVKRNQVGWSGALTNLEHTLQGEMPAGS